MNAVYRFVFLLGSVFLCFFTQAQTSVNASGTTVGTRFSAPVNYTRVHDNEASFANYLSHFPLKPNGEKVLLYNGSEKYRQDVHVAVLNMDVGLKDLQQCADAVMRLRAEFLYSKKRYDEISFHFTNGFKAEYKKWRQGYRIRVKGNDVKWYLGEKPSDSRESFMAYLQTVFMYAGTRSLQKELKPKALKDIVAGDVFIQGGSPGHAVIVMDVAVHVKTKEKIFILAQSYMPAQNIHVLKNFNDADLSPWYPLKENQTLKTPEWYFAAGSLYGFE
jgi:hypothetical protein